MLSHPRGRALEGVALAVLLGLTALYAAHPIFSVDLHWHLKLGQWIAEHRALPNTDLFSAVEPDRPYVQFNWLWDLLAFQVHALGSERAIRVMQVVVQCLAIGTLYFVTRRTFGRWLPALFVATLALTLFEDRFRARPDAVTLTFVALTLPALLAHARPSRRELLVLGALGALWSNLHAGASLWLPAATGAVAVGASIARRWRMDGPDERGAWLRAGASGLGVALSPSLVPGFLHWLSAIGPQIGAGNEEWQPTWSMLSHGLSPAFVLVGLTPTFVGIVYAVEEGLRVRRERRAAATPAAWLLSALALALAHQAVRNSGLCVVPLVMLLSSRLKGAPANVSQRTWDRSSVAFAAGTVVLLVASFQDAVVAGYGGLRNARSLIAYDLAPDTYPEEAARFLREAGIEGGIVNDGRWGGYLIWHAWPKCAVFVDTRHHLTADMWDVFRRSHGLRERPQALNDAFERWGVELSLLRAPTFPVEPDPRWQLLYKAGEQELYQHVDGAHYQANLRRTRAWLARHGLLLSEAASGQQLAAAARGIGGAQWLAGPYQHRRMERAEHALAGDTPASKARGHRIRGELWLMADRHAAAATDLDAAVTLAPNDPRAHYLALRNRLALTQRGDGHDATDPQVHAHLRALSQLDARALDRQEAIHTAMLMRALAASQ